MLKVTNAKDFIIDRVGEIEIEVLDNNTEYNNLRGRRRELFKIVEEQLPEKYKKALLELESIYNYCSIMENEIMYKQGLKDYTTVRNSLLSSFLNRI